MSRRLSQHLWLLLLVLVIGLPSKFLMFKKSKANQWPNRHLHQSQLLSLQLLITYLILDHPLPLHNSKLRHLFQAQMLMIPGPLDGITHLSLNNNNRNKITTIIGVILQLQFNSHNSISNLKFNSCSSNSRNNLSNNLRQTICCPI